MTHALRAIHTGIQLEADFGTFIQTVTAITHQLITADVGLLQGIVGFLTTGIDEGAAQTQLGVAARKILLVEYSGGGAVAALLAARRSDVTKLITVAGNLDHLAWTRLHNLSPLTNSLNPADYITALSAIPQLHFVGENDTVIAPSLIENYINHFDKAKQPRLKIIPTFDHICCWARDWQTLIKNELE